MPQVLNLLLSQDESVRASGLHQLGTLRRALSGVLEAVTHLDLSNTPLQMLPEGTITSRTPTLNLTS